MKLTGMPSEIYAAIEAENQAASQAVTRAQGAIKEGKWKQSIYPYQAAALFHLACPYNFTGARILEIGTYYGFSAAVLAQAAPKAAVITLNPLAWEVAVASHNLAGYPNVSVIWRKSQEYFEMLAPGVGFDFVFVDGDHACIQDDFRFWDRLREGGLMLFHDYSPQTSARPCHTAYTALNELRDYLGRDFDVLIIDAGLAGMVGYYKQDGDKPWQK